MDGSGARLVDIASVEFVDTGGQLVSTFVPMMISGAGLVGAGGGDVADGADAGAGLGSGVGGSNGGN